VAIAIFFTFLAQALWMIFLIGGILQILYITLGLMVRLYKKKGSKIETVKEKEEN
jgi:hypothetical protein